MALVIAGLDHRNRSEYGVELRLRHRAVPDGTPSHFLLKAINAPQITIVAQEDLILPRSVARCQMILEKVEEGSDFLLLLLSTLIDEVAIT